MAVSIQAFNRWDMYLSTSDERDPRLVQYRVQIDRLQPSKSLQLIWETYLSEDVATISHLGIFDQRHDIPRPPMNIDFLHNKDGRGGDRWFPNTYQTWHAIWDAREEHVMIIPRFLDSGPSEVYLRWWFLIGKRFLSGDAAPPDARLMQVSMVDDVPDNQRLERRLGFVACLRQALDAVVGRDVKRTDKRAGPTGLTHFHDPTRQGGKGGTGQGARGDGADGGGDGAGGGDDQPDRGWGYGPGGRSEKKTMFRCR
ncbi:hypothetical protein PIB30_060682 [Stylosanthes scabra]|uniref:Aminotransferase-like plant mobile domain-containing protein n=1 Tax=Stylosanthes scabra TaxID=79078 RepID=A0ABU6QKI0_9FABA|nr:hypothetical protein [Stylosanthes scabra]